MAVTLNPRQSYAKLEFKVKDGKVYCDYFITNNSNPDQQNDEGRN